MKKAIVARHIEQTTTYEISAEDIYTAFGLPRGAKLFVRVPGGGDWSNTELEIRDAPIICIAKEDRMEIGDETTK